MGPNLINPAITVVDQARLREVGIGPEKVFTVSEAEAVLGEKRKECLDPNYSYQEALIGSSKPDPIDDLTKPVNNPMDNIILDVNDNLW